MHLTSNRDLRTYQVGTGKTKLWQLHQPSEDITDESSLSSMIIFILFWSILITTVLSQLFVFFFFSLCLVRTACTEISLCHGASFRCGHGDPVHHAPLASRRPGALSSSTWTPAAAAASPRRERTRTRLGTGTGLSRQSRCDAGTSSSSSATVPSPKATTTTVATTTTTGVVQRPVE